MISPSIDRTLRCSSDPSVRAREIAANSSSREIRHGIETLLLEDAYLKDLLSGQTSRCDRYFLISYAALSVNLGFALAAPWCFPNPIAIIAFTAILQGINALILYIQQHRLYRTAQRERANCQHLLILHQSFSLLQNPRED